MQFAAPLAQLIESFQRLPGIGPKTAQRLAFHVLKQSQAEVSQFSEALITAKESIRPCAQCFNLTEQTLCDICTQQGRQHGLVCVVPDVRDVYALERTGEYRGVYHVLQGLISPMAGKGPDDLTIQQLMQRLTARDPEHPQVVEEVILALPPSIEGDTTSLYLSRLIHPLGIRLTRIGFGLPVGGDLEYADNLTIARALQARQKV